MPDDELVPDHEVQSRLSAALYALGRGRGLTTRGASALRAAREAIILLMVGHQKAMDDDTDKVDGIIPD